MVRPGMKRLREAQNVKVQPNKTGTSFMLGQSVVVKKEMIEKRGVVFDSSANTPYNDFENSNRFQPTYTSAEEKLDQNRRCVMKKSWTRDSNGKVVPKSWNLSWQKVSSQ